MQQKNPYEYYRTLNNKEDILIFVFFSVEYKFNS